ncbi:MAG: hypothetical protein WCE45_02760, partial [Sedimentisphaerales bacterium]
MDWQFITENKLIQHFKAHWLYLLFAPVFAWVMSNFLTTPTITAVAIVFLGYMALVILLEVWIKSKICHWIKSGNLCYFIIYFGLLIVCILIALPFWNKLVYMCDRDNPYKQLLRTGTATIEMRFQIINDNNNAKFSFRNGSCATLLLYTNHLLLSMTASSCNYLPNIYNECYYWYEATAFNLSEKIGEPISDIMEANLLRILIPDFPANSNIIDGNATLV